MTVNEAWLLRVFSGLGFTAPMWPNMAGIHVLGLRACLGFALPVSRSLGVYEHKGPEYKPPNSIGFPYHKDP